jgi:hypothetical protein
VTAAKKALSTHRKRRARKPARSGVDQRLSQICAKALAGEPVECAWEIFRLQHFPGWKPTDIAGALGAWSLRHGIKVEFGIRKLHSVDVIFMVFTHVT